MQNFKRKYVKKQKHLKKGLNNDKGIKKEVFKSISKLFKSLLDDYTKTQKNQI